MVQRLSCCGDLAEVMEVLRESVRGLTGADGVTVVLREGDLCHYAEEDAIGPLWKGRRFPLEACISGWSMLHREKVVVPDIYADPRIPHDAYRPTFVKSLAMVPIRSEDPIGAIGAYWGRRHEASPGELEILQALADSAAMAIANVQLIDSLKEASRQKDEFLAMLAHELRNPLAPLQNALHILRLRAEEGQPIAPLREMMERQVRHLARMVDDLLDVSRLSRGKIALRRERLDLARVVRQSAGDRSGVFGAGGLSLELDVPQTPVWVIGDATRLAQVLGNLLENAAKFTPRGGTVTVSLAADPAGAEAVLCVRDTGIGIEPELLPHVFEVFAQADRSLDRASGGLGLGLSVARSLLELHGGTIAAASEGSGRGAQFTIRLPRAPELPAVAPGPAPARQPAKDAHVLVVEDCRDTAESLRMLLELCGYQVTLASTGGEGVKAAESGRPDVVLCDIGLPGMDGFAVARALRENRDTASARLIAVTGYGADEDRRQALEAGFDAHLVKPVALDKLLGHLAPAAAGR